MLCKVGSRNLTALVLSLVLYACAQQAPPLPPPTPDTRAADEAAVTQVAEAREKAIAARDVDKILTFYEPEGWQMAANGSIAKTDAERRLFWEGVKKLPIAHLMVDVDTSTVVSRSGDIAARYGTFRQTTIDKQGNPESVVQKNMSLWRKQPDGTWKVMASIATAQN